MQLQAVTVFCILPDMAKNKTALKTCQSHHTLLQNVGVGEFNDNKIRSAEKFLCLLYKVTTVALVMKPGLCYSAKAVRKSHCHQPLMQHTFIYRLWFGNKIHLQILISHRSQLWVGCSMKKTKADEPSSITRCVYSDYFMWVY